MKRIFFLLVFTILLIPLISSYPTKIIKPDKFEKWSVALTGEEAILFKKAIVGTNPNNNQDYVCIRPTHPNFSPVITQENCSYDINGLQTNCTNVSHSYQSIMPWRNPHLAYVIMSNHWVQQLHAFCFNLDRFMSRWYKLGNHSLVINGDSVYPANQTNNVTLENKFAHLNISDPHLVNYWSFDENVSSTTTYDYSNNSKDGIINGATYVSGKYGGAYSFDGVNDYLNLGSSKLNSDTQGTISAWIKIPSYSPNNYMVSWGGGATSNPGLFGFRIQSDLLGVVQRTNGGAMGGVKGNETLSYNTWHHGVVTSDGTQWKLYLDGRIQSLTVIIGSNTGNWLGDTSVSAPRKMKIGGGTYNGNDVYYFNGSLDDIMVWDRALNQTEITNLYNEQYQRFYPTGDMLFQNNNFSTNNTANITLDNCQTNMGSRLRAKINSGNWANFSNCVINSYSITGDLTNANLTIGLVAGNESNSTTFYSPLVIGNITLDSWLVSPVTLINISRILPNYNLTTPHIKYGDHLIFR